MTASFYGANSEQRTPRPPEPARNLQYHFDLTPPTGPLSPAAKGAREEALEERTARWQLILMFAAVVFVELIVLGLGTFIGIWWERTH